MRAFRQVDVFGAETLLGNPLAVVHDAGDVSEEQLRRFARWTNLSETTFLLPPSTPEADYRVRILTPSTELPFAGHPTLGTAHAWLEAGGVPRASGGPEVVVQECGAGLVRVRRTDGGRLAFAAPPLVRSGPVDDVDLAPVLEALGLGADEVVEAGWIDNGPGWLGLLLADVDRLMAIRPPATEGRFDVGAVARYPDGDERAPGCAVEVRAFMGGAGEEDPVTGSLNAGLAQWLGGRVLPTSYTASQGTALGRRGRVQVDTVEGQVWVAGEVRTLVVGEVGL